MEVLQSLVVGIQLQGEVANRRAEREKDAKIAKLTEEDDIVAYLTMFERIMTAYEIKKECWAFKLAANLVGRAQQAYAALSSVDAASYEKLKAAILQRYDITEESYRQRFRSVRKKTGESSRELVSRLNDLAHKWLKDCESVDEVEDKVVLEQFINTLSEEVKIFVLERKPESSEEAGKLADDFQQARKFEKKEFRRSEDCRRVDNKAVRNCLSCGKPGHLAKDCKRKATGSGGQKSPKYKKEVECFNCHKKGHYSSQCPYNALHCTERRVDHRGSSTAV